ncbi:MAG: hypothetical protein ACLFUZ_05020 [Candidatus Micrarchaeia archaeon]
MKKKTASRTASSSKRLKLKEPFFEWADIGGDNHKNYYKYCSGRVGFGGKDVGIRGK